MDDFFDDPTSLFDAFTSSSASSSHAFTENENESRLLGTGKHDREDGEEELVHSRGMDSASESPQTKRSKFESSVGVSPAILMGASLASSGDNVSRESSDPRFTSRGDCLHEVSLPPDYTGPDPFHLPDTDRPPAKEYKFELDAFQRVSVRALEHHHSVLVAAHTSAGKTAVAEYAIAMGLRDSQRVVYTSPIKALSNQKYRELSDEFQDVGLMTGDVTINPNASCLVMTTEILRSMLYRGSEILREVAYVIFDEIHYMRDRERGVVWEETIVLLPDKIRFVFLSATIPNAKEFADWICKLHNQPVHVVYTEFRPTPLQHYVFPSGGEGVYLIVNEKSEFKEDTFQKALAVLQSPNDAVSAELAGGGDGRKKKKGPNQGSDVKRILKMILERKFDPVIVFSFSKRECESLASQLSKIDFNSDEEKKLVDVVFNNAIDSLLEEDKKLPQVLNILPLLRRGIGIHHGGLLPLLKEVIEILFQEGLLKVLFSTETFSMGLNMPAKTVVFTSIRKFDGETYRWISGGEYIQMSGRAGRRGLDDRGIVILMIDDKLDPSTAKSMLMGHSDPLNSQFHLSYNMLLNLLRIETVEPEYIMVRSFHQFQAERQKPQLQNELEHTQLEIDAYKFDDEETVAEYYKYRKQIDRYTDTMHKVMCSPTYCLPFLQPGRLIKVSYKEQEWGWGVIVNFQKQRQKTKRGSSSLPPEDMNAASYIVDVLLSATLPNVNDSASVPQPARIEDPEARLHVLPIELHMVEGFSSVRLFLPKDIRSDASKKQVLDMLREVHRRFPDGLPPLDPIEDMEIEDKEFIKCMKKMELLQTKLQSSSRFRNYDNLYDAYQSYSKKIELQEKKRRLERLIRSSETVVMRDELKAMKRVLRRLGYTNEENVIQMKGRVACEINTADEIVLTELIYNGVFNNLSVEQTVSLLSCFVVAERSDDEVSLREELSGPYRELVDTVKRVGSVSSESKMTLDVEEYVQSFRPAMMEVVFAWCKGARFAEICKMTTMFEGSIIRAIRRLEELMRQLCSASKTIGDEKLAEKFDAGINMIKRDIVFAASLYL